jgi:F-type H+-transporting ATPase subunit alpha
LEAFTSFDSDLDEKTKTQIDRGRKATALLRQNEGSPLSMPQEVIILYALDNGWVDAIPLDKITAFETSLLRTAATHPTGKSLLAALTQEKDLTPTIITNLEKLLTVHQKTFI